MARRKRQILMAPCYSKSFANPKHPENDWGVRAEVDLAWDRALDTLWPPQAGSQPPVFDGVRATDPLSLCKK